MMTPTRVDSTNLIPSNLQIAQGAILRPIEEIADALGLTPDEVEPYGRYKAKIDLSALERLADRPQAKIVCVAGINPTKAGEGKTTTAVGLTQGLGHIGREPVLCLREPSLGPVFGIKGGAAGGGYTQVVPMEDLNLHFTGDIHAISAANNLLAAMLEASLLHGNPLSIDPLTVTWKRAVDINDRALREIVVGLGGRANGYPRESGFDITAASEVMAIAAVARGLADLRARLGAITVGHTFSGEPVTAEQVGAAGAMAVLLKDALKPNLIQTLEGQPCLMHCGPFANIAHGNSSLVADLLGIRLGEYVVTESGFGSDMGMEKFFDIVCRVGGLVPSAVVLVCTVRALKHHGGGEDQAALERGIGNLRRHIGIVREFGLPCVVAVNRRPGDLDDELQWVRATALALGADAAELNEGFERGGEGAADLARAVVAACEQESHFQLVYRDEDTITQKIEAVARRVYGADGVSLSATAEQQIAQFEADGLGTLPICMAKTQYSLSADPELLNAPEGFVLPVREVRAYTGAGWLVPLCGDVMQMPGLGKQPAALDVDLEPDGRVVGLF
jgi:formate--tetrahydrofolate ligase